MTNIDVKKKRKKLIKYIHNHVGDLTLEDRKQALNLLAPYIDMTDIYEEGTGIRVMYKHIVLYQLQDIAEYIKLNRFKTQLKF